MRAQLSTDLSIPATRALEASSETARCRSLRGTARWSLAACCFAAALAGCVEASPEAEVTETPAPIGTEPDETPAPAVTDAPDRALGSVEIDTTALTIDGITDPAFVRDGDVAILFASSFEATGDIVVVGDKPLVIRANGDVLVTGSIDASASGRTAGPGAVELGAGANGATVLYDERHSAGGGGAGHGTVGAPGGGRADLPGALAGAAYTSDGLVGGSRGGDGGFAYGDIGAGGAGGGALQIASATSITIEGSLRASGGGGAGGGGGFVGGGGGGSGGTLLIEAPTLVIAGSLIAHGGGGGGGGAGCGDCETMGSDGANGATERAPGGIGGIPQGSPGGFGATTVRADAGNGDNSKGGGGGGGAGRIILRGALDTTGAIISPAAE